MKDTEGIIFWLLHLDGRNISLRNVSAHLLPNTAS